MAVATSAALGCLTFLLLARRRSDQLNMRIGPLAVARVLVFVANECGACNKRVGRCSALSHI